MNDSVILKKNIFYVTSGLVDMPLLKFQCGYLSYFTLDLVTIWSKRSG